MSKPRAPIYGNLEKLLDLEVCEFCGNNATIYYISGAIVKRLIICCDECDERIVKYAANSSYTTLVKVNKEEATVYEITAL